MVKLTNSNSSRNYKYDNGWVIKYLFGSNWRVTLCVKGFADIGEDVEIGNKSLGVFCGPISWEKRKKVSWVNR